MVGLRYDLTVPFARYVARYLPSGDLRLPFRRSQVQTVWRADSPQAGRFREFTQCDFDIAGSSEPESDAEVLLVAEALLVKLGVGFQVRVSHRGVLDGLLRALEVPDDVKPAVMGLLDKLEKIGPNGVLQQLQGERCSLAESQARRLLEVIDEAEELPKGLDESGTQATKNLETVVNLAKAAAIDPKHIVADLSIIRGLAYYTGVVLETVLDGGESYGSVLSGGRYDNTIGTFVDREVPAVGASLGLDRTLSLMGKLGLLPADQSLASLVIIPFPECREQGLVLAQRLRQRGMDVVLSIEAGRLGDLLASAAHIARFALILGSEELRTGRFKLKNLTTKEQVEVTEKELFGRIS